MTTDVLVDQLLSDLARAQLGDSDFVRFLVDPHDDGVARIIESSSLLEPASRTEFRRRLDDDAVFMLRRFSQRRTLQGFRENSRQLLHEALTGFSLLPFANVPWDTWLRAALFLARPLGEDLEVFASTFEDSAQERAGIAVSAVGRVADLGQCHLVEVTTSYGVGLVELPAQKDRASRGRSVAPLLDHNAALYEPSTNLAAVAARLADAIDAQKPMRAGWISYSQLAAQWFSLRVTGSWLPTTGGLGFSAQDENGVDFNVVVAELASDVDIASLPPAAANDEGQGAVVKGNCLVLFTPVPNFEDVEGEKVFDSRACLDFARTALDSIV
jgi:hypothetical protein